MPSSFPAQVPIPMWGRAPTPIEPDLALFAHCAYAAGHVDATIDAWERVHAEGLRAGDRLMAAGAAVRVALHLLFDGESAVPCAIKL